MDLPVKNASTQCTGDANDTRLLLALALYKVMPGALQHRLDITGRLVVSCVQEERFAIVAEVGRFAVVRVGLEALMTASVRL